MWVSVSGLTPKTMAMRGRTNILKMAAVLLVAVSAVSCTYDEPEIVRTSSDAAYKYACNRFEEHLATHITEAHAILSAEHWASLESDSARYAYEDVHFIFFKLRKLDDGIALVDLKGMSRKITGNGLPFDQQGAVRTLDNLTLTNLGDNTYRAECDFSTPCDYHLPDNAYVEKLEWTILHNAAFSDKSEMLNITDGTGSIQAQGLKIDYQAANLMCEVVCRSRYEWLYNDVWPFYGTVKISARSAVMEAEGADPDRFTVTYLGEKKKQITY